MSMTSWDVITHTSDVRGAGTHARVSIKLHGASGSTSPVPLIRTNAFRRNQTDSFAIEAEDVGPLKQITVWHDNDGLGAGWHLSKVVVIHNPTGQKYLFPVNRWLDDREDDGAVLRTIPVAKSESGQVAVPTFAVSVGFDFCNIPHPKKHKTGGEDAWMMAYNRTEGDQVYVVGVADGVGEWASKGVDAAEFSKTLMKHAQQAFEASPSRAASEGPRAVLQQAWDAVAPRVSNGSLVGSSTACLVTVQGKDGLLQAVNLGDSGLVVLRGGKVFFRTPQHEHFFGCPFQLGTNSKDSVADAQSFQVHLIPDDVIVVASDGLFDNLDDKELLSICRLSGGNSKRAAKALADRAFEFSLDRRADTPYSRQASEEFFQPYSGGKMDDITVIVGHVSKE
eukprot:TRINITY_DN12078_c0_g1_i2.p1 TRINITY_DN12078_c0_g1~~TRINITY_DN12078_c0_g1_i2.p1  ORF type:complete len:414 (-),score=81.80 TRINITY_DN12078_c0_g1_i2:20-1201(-)